MSRVDTLRVSVTDRCNLRCIYCMPRGGVVRLPHPEILRFEEIERVVRAAAAQGVTKVRITGGEPLVRHGIVELVGKLAVVPGVRDLPLTTNGVMLGQMAPDLKAAGLSRVTVSLDTLRPDRFERITGRPWLHKVRRGLASARDAGLGPIKVNVVPVPGENDDEVLDFVELARSEDLEIRFIERMPMTRKGEESRCGRVSDDHIPSARLIELIEKSEGPLDKVTKGGSGGPARVFALPGGQGRIGVISPMTEPFCRWCSRMRLTAEGKLRACLASSRELDLKDALRRGAGDKELQELFARAVAEKPRQDAACFDAPGRSMYQIGG